tara:strand:+ start:1353 stop:2399 length:1047 start_codon:yes stop_codon:yes gene_type:complete
MTKARDLADLISTGNPLADGAIAVAEVTGAAPLASPTFTGTATAPTINASTALQIGGVAITSTAAELNKMDGVTVGASDINTVTAKAPSASPTFTGDVTLPDKIVHTGDTNTAIRFPADDTVAFETGGSERFRFASAGQLGIAGANYGTSGQVLQSGGASGAASWADAGGGAHEIISTVTLNNTSNVQFTGLGTGSYIIYLYNVMTSSNAKIEMFIFDAATGNQINSCAGQIGRAAYSLTDTGGVTSRQANNNAVVINESRNQIGGSEFGVTATIEISGFDDTNQEVQGFYRSLAIGGRAYNDANGVAFDSCGFAYRTAITGVKSDKLKLEPTSGNLKSGKIVLVKKP